MGVRIHKKMGFGLTNLQVDDDSYINDPKVNTQLSYPSLTEYNDFLKQEREKNNLTPTTKYDDTYILDGLINAGRRTDTFITFLEGESLEGHDNGVLLIQPLLIDNTWTRTDDDMDYMEYFSMFANDGPLVKFSILPSTPFPYSGVMNKYTLQTINSNKWKTIKDYRGFRDKNEDNPKLEQAISKLLEDIGFASFEEAQDSIVPYVPDTLKTFVDYLGLFNDNSIIGELRPMILTYWE